jgi:fucose permease
MLSLAAFSGVLIYGMIAALLGTILPELSKKFNLKPQQMAQIAMAQAVGLVLASIFVGPLIDGQGHKVALVVALGLVGGALLMLPRSAGFGMIALLLFIVGFGGGIIVAGANSLNGNVQQEFGWGSTFTSNIMNLWFGLGGLLTPFIMANLFKGNAYKLLYFIATVAGASLALNAIAPLPPAAATGAGYDMALFSNGNFWLVSALLFLYIAAEVGVWNWLVQHLISVGLPEKSALNILSLGFALGLIGGRLATGLLPADVNPAMVTLGCAVLMALFTYGMLQVKDGKAAGGLVFATGVAMGPVFPTAIAITQAKVVGNTALGLALVFGWLGLAVSSPLIGALTGGETKNLKTALLILPGCAAIMAVVSYLLR